MQVSGLNAGSPGRHDRRGPIEVIRRCRGPGEQVAPAYYNSWVINSFLRTVGLLCVYAIVPVDLEEISRRSGDGQRQDELAERKKKSPMMPVTGAEKRVQPQEPDRRTAISRVDDRTTRSSGGRRTPAR